METPCSMKNCIFVCIFNHKKYIEMFYLLLESILLYGNLGDDTDIIVYTSTEFMEIIKKSQYYNSNNMIFETNDTYNDIDSACKSRLDLFKLSAVSNYKKIIYLDTDIIIKDDIHKVFAICKEDILYVLEEGDIRNELNYWGKVLFGDEINNYDDKTGFTSGILLFNNCEKIRDLFNNITQDIIDRPYKLDCIDQPYFVYNAFKYNLYNNKIMKSLAINNDYNILSDKVIHHFPGGPGIYGLKIDKMRIFLNNMKSERETEEETYIIQVGSHIGNTSNDFLFNNINQKYKYIMIEPVPHLFEKLRENYKSYSNITCLNIAISNYNGYIELYTPSQTNDFSNLVNWTNQLSSVNKDHISTFVPECIIDTISVECKTLNTIIIENNIQHIEYLYTDTEGHDYDILMNLNLSAIRPKNIIFENKHIDGPKHKLDRLNAPKYHSLLDHFKEYGYEVKLETEEDTHITLFKTITNDKEIRKKYIDEILSKRFTLVSRERLENCYHQCKKFMNTNYSFVECGVAKGGSLAIMKVAAGKNNKIFGFDSFEGMPPVTNEDIDNYNKDDPRYWVGKLNENGINDVYNIFNTLNLDMNNVTLVQGFFQDILQVQENIDNIGKIAVLRLDGDWYESTKICLEKLYDKVVDNGIIIIDDYGHFIGAKKATDEFRMKQSIITPLIKTDYTEYYWIKNQNIDSLLSDSVNIDDDIWTCSDKMRYDIYHFFKDKPKFAIAEIGAHKGYSTKILSKIFKKVYAVDNSIEWTNFNKNYNKESTNIEYVMLDIYKNSWEILPKDIEVSFIDAYHTYETCKSDIMNSIKQFENLQYIIFDDYGVWPGVKQVVDELIKCNVLIFEKCIGLNDIPGPNGIVKNSNEGIICSVNSVIRNIKNKSYTWGNSAITFLDNFEMNAYGRGYYRLIDQYNILSFFGGKVHCMVFNNDYTSFVSTRKGDSEIVKGKLIRS
jgi:O-methyltransferase